MRGANPKSSEKTQAPYTRKRDNPQFQGMRRNNSTFSAREATFDTRGDITKSSISRSLSDIWDIESKRSAPDAINSIAKKSLEKSGSNLVLETQNPSFPGIQSKSGSSMQMPIDGCPPYDLGKADDSVSESILRSSEVCDSADNGNKNKLAPSRVSLPQSAASYYCGDPPKTDVSILEMCESIDCLNRYLKARKADLKAGVPGRFLHAVIGPEVADVGSVVSVILYAFFLNETQNSSHLCTVPIINMKRADLNAHTELKWLLDSCRVEQSYLVFIDEIDLSYYDLFGNLKLVLLNCHKLPAKQEGLKEALVEIFYCKQVDSLYPWVEDVTIGEDCSCCTLVAEKFSETSPETLAGQGFSRLLLSGILLDTVNLTNANCTSKDKYMATLLIKGAGRFGCSGLHQILKHKMFDISDLKVRDILRKDFKKWTRVAGKPDSTGSRLTVSHIGMSSIGISVEDFLAHEDSAAQEVILFQQSEKLRLLMIVSGYYDSQKNFKREILVSTNTAELMRNFLHFFNTNGKSLPLKVLHQQDLREELKAFEIDNKLTSRRSIERLLEEFGGSQGKHSSGV